MHGEGGISIWFFIGSLLTVYGLLITGAELLGFGRHEGVVLAELRAGLWWGLLLLVLGLIYTIRFRPGRN
jgi:hypothetical protein